MPENKEISFESKQTLTKLFKWIYNSKEPIPTDEDLKRLEDVPVRFFHEYDPTAENLSIHEQWKKLLLKVHPDKMIENDNRKSTALKVMQLINSIYQSHNEAGLPVAQAVSTESVSQMTIMLTGVQFSEVDKSNENDRFPNALACDYRRLIDVRVDSFMSDLVNTLPSDINRWPEKITNYIRQHQTMLPHCFAASHPWLYFTIFADNYCKPKYDVVFQHLTAAAVDMQLREKTFDNGRSLVGNLAFDFLSMNRLFFLWGLYKSHFPQVFSPTNFPREKRAHGNLHDLPTQMCRYCPNETHVADLFIRYHHEIAPLKGFIEQTPELFVESFIKFARHFSASTFRKLIEECFKETLNECLSLIPINELSLFLQYFFNDQPALCIAAIKAKHDPLLQLALAQASDPFGKSRQLVVSSTNQSGALTLCNEGIAGHMPTEDPLTQFLKTFHASNPFFAKLVKPTNPENLFHLVISVSPDFFEAVLNSKVDQTHVARLCEIGKLGEKLQQLAIVKWTEFYLKTFQKNNNNYSSYLLTWVSSEKSAEMRFYSDLMKIVFQEDSLPEKYVNIKRTFISFFRSEPTGKENRCLNFNSTEICLLKSLRLIIPNNSSVRCAFEPAPESSRLESYTKNDVSYN